jgi:DNA-binding transcriptional LysR family regulator
MTLDDLRLFVAACDAGSLSAAARRHGTSQPAVSQHVRRLERELDVALLERGRRGVAPTAAGRILLTSATEALGALDAGRRELDQLRRGAGGTLRVATGGPTFRHFMTRPLAGYRRRHPGVTFEYVSATSTRGCLDALRAGAADLAFVTLAGDQGLEPRPSVRTPWVLVVAAADPLARGGEARPADLRSVPLVGMPESSASRAQLEADLAGHGVRVRFGATVDDWDTAVQLVELGVGRAVVPAMWVHDLADRTALRARPLRGLAPVTFGWVARRWEALPPHARAFAALVDAGFRAMEPAARVEVLADPAAEPPPEPPPEPSPGVGEPPTGPR